MLAEHQLSAGSNARNDDMASARQKDKIEKIMHEHKESTLKSDSGKKVKTRHLIGRVAQPAAGHTRPSGPAQIAARADFLTFLLLNGSSGCLPGFLRCD